MEGTVQIEDVIVPEIFTPTVQQLTREKSALILSGALTVDPAINSHLSGSGLTFQTPSYRDLENDEENISTDDAADKYTGGNNDSKPNKTSMTTEVSVRLSRNNSWASADLVSALTSTDPMQSIASRVSDYWTRRLQRAFVATVTGVFADNAADPGGSDTHTKDDMTNNIAFDSNGDAIAYSDGVTTFTAEGVLDTLLTMGDSMSDLTMMMVHSVVFNIMQKQDLIKYLRNSEGTTDIPTYLGRRVIVDDGMPSSNGVYQTWIFGESAVRFGQGSPKVPTATARHEESGQGGGSEVLYNRVEWCFHPEGHRFQAAPPNGGPNNSATIGNLANADSWSRVFTERKQIRMARYITREHG